MFCFLLHVSFLLFLPVLIIRLLKKSVVMLQAYASEAKSNTSLQLPKIPSFHKFARREQYAQMDESDLRRKWSGGVSGRQDCISEIDSRNCRVRNWSVDFPAACVNLESSRMSADNHSQRSHSNDIACPLNFREHSGESAAVDSSLFTKAWVDSAGSVGIKDYHAIERWQSQAAAADSDFYQSTRHIRDEEDSNTISQPPTWKHDRQANESSVSHVTVNKELVKNQPRGAENIKQAVVDYVGSLLMPLYKARKIDKEGYKSIMKKSATKVKFSSFYFSSVFHSFIIQFSALGMHKSPISYLTFMTLHFIGLNFRLWSRPQMWRKLWLFLSFLISNAGIRCAFYLFMLY